MTNEITLPTVNQDLVKQLKQSNRELPFLNIAQAKSDVVEKQDLMKAGQIFIWQTKDIIGEFIEGGRQMIPPVLSQVKLLFGHWRPVATRIINGAVEGRSNNPQDKMFQEILAGARSKDKTCMAGFEHLVKVIDDKKFTGWAIYSFTKTAADTAPLDDGIGFTYNFRTRLVETKKYSWWTPDVIKLTEPQVNLEEDEEYLLLAKAFLEKMTIADTEVER